MGVWSKWCTLVSQDEIHRKAQSGKTYDRIAAANQFHDNFSDLPDKKQAWKDVYRLIHDEEDEVRWRGARALSVAFPHIPDRNQAWKELIQLTKDKNHNVWQYAAYSLAIGFHCTQDKIMAWSDIHQLTQDKNNIIQLNAADVIGANFSLIPDKKIAWDDLKRLEKHEKTIVRASAKYALGRASIFKATEVNNDDQFKKELEKAIRFFKASLYEVEYGNPAKFCLLFYKSFYTITFKKMKAEVHKYLVQAKNAVGSSESKEKLLEAVDNLANALQEAQKAQDKSLEERQNILNACRGYCERAANLLEAVEEKAPLATKVIKKMLPIIDGKINSTITEVRERAEVLYKNTLNTPFEKLGKEINHIGQDFLTIRDPIGLEKSQTNLQTALANICAKLPETERGEACELLKKVDAELYIGDKLPLISIILSKISSQMSATKNTEILEKKIDEIMVSLKPGIREEIVITVGAEFAGTGAKHEIHIPLQEITYPEIKNDLEKIKGKTIFKLASLPAKLADKVRAYILRTKKDELLKYLT